ncbi:MAG TPA: MogA/MoaB family molybdenum cofactor biosynthesis protein [Candidatus Binatia bacterium]|jgi:molybdenum cofactor biosynthesis protein B
MTKPVHRDGNPGSGKRPAATSASPDHRDAGSHGDAASHHHAGDARAIACAVITVSDTRTLETDISGREIRELLVAAGHRVETSRIVADEPTLVRTVLEELASAGRIDAVLLSGGTGLAARDTTFEAVGAVLTKRIDGFGELFRALSFEEIGAAAMLSRAVAGLAGTMAVFSMPGSTGACRLAMQRLILPQLAHVVGLARPRCEAHDHRRGTP